MTTSIMAKEAAEAPRVIGNQLRLNHKICAELGEKIRERAPKFVYIIGRGSSDHAGVFAKYLIEVEMGVPVCAAAPSVNSLFGQNVNLKDALVLIISQSGRSPDILAQTKSAKESGAFCVALINDTTSPLSYLADMVLPLSAGKEVAVAATKSYLATLSAVLQMVAHWKQEEVLMLALEELPNALQKVVDGETQLKQEFVESLAHCVVLGRGFGYAISREIALKLKEVLGVHAEAFSSAEFLHGPVTLVEKKLAIVSIDIEDESHQAHQEIVAEVTKRGAVMAELTAKQGIIHQRFLPLAVLQRFYLDIEKIAVSMGLDPDEPAGLKKVTQTL